MNKEKWILKEDEKIWRVTDLIAEGSSDEVYKTQYWRAINNGFNVFRTKEEAEMARDEILKILWSGGIWSEIEKVP